MLESNNPLFVLKQDARQIRNDVELAAKVEQAVADFDILPATEHERLWSWNGTVPPAVNRCVHTLVEEQARMQPGATAVSAWDGELTYAELDGHSSRLAQHLATLGVGAEVIVPLCFEKSRWTVVAMVAVLKAGGAFVLLDPSQPKSRLRSIVQQTKPALSRDAQHKDGSTACSRVL